MELESSNIPRPGMEETEQLEYNLWHEEDLEAARMEAEKGKYIDLQPASVSRPPLRKCLEKGPQQQFQAY